VKIFQNSLWYEFSSIIQHTSTIYFWSLKFHVRGPQTSKI